MESELTTSELVQRMAGGSRLECVEAAKELDRRGDLSAIPEVVEIVRQAGSGFRREIAAWLLGLLTPGPSLSIEALHSTIRDPSASEDLRGQAIESLGNAVGHLSGGEVYERAADLFIALLEDPSVEIVYNAVFALGAIRCIDYEPRGR